MRRTFRGLIRSFGCAFRGIYRTVRKERNFRVHLVASALVFWFSLLYGVTAGQSAILVTVCSLVLSLELLNTALEHTVDLISPGYSPLAEWAKDASAGGVLIAAIGAVITAVILFRDPERWRSVLVKMQSPVRWIGLALFLVSALFFVRGRKEKNREV